MQLTAVANHVNSLRDFLLFIAVLPAFSSLKYCSFYLGHLRKSLAPKTSSGDCLITRQSQLRHLIPRFNLDYAGSMSCCR